MQLLIYALDFFAILSNLEFGSPLQICRCHEKGEGWPASRISNTEMSKWKLPERALSFSFHLSFRKLQMAPAKLLLEQSPRSTSSGTCVGTQILDFGQLQHIFREMIFAPETGERSIRFAFSMGTGRNRHNAEPLYHNLWEGGSGNSRQLCHNAWKSCLFFYKSVWNCVSVSPCNQVDRQADCRFFFCPQRTRWSQIT